MVSRGCGRMRVLSGFRRKAEQGFLPGERRGLITRMPLRLLPLGLNSTVFIEVFIPRKHASQGLKPVKFSTSALSDCRTCHFMEHYYSIQYNNNRRWTAGSERSSALPRSTQEGFSGIPTLIPKVSLPGHYTLPLRVQMSPLYVSYVLQQIPSSLQRVVDNFFFFYFFFPVARIRQDFENKDKTSWMSKVLSLQVWV